MAVARSDTLLHVAGVQDDTQKLGYLVRAHSSVLKALRKWRACAFRSCCGFCCLTGPFEDSNPGSSSLNLVEAEILAHEAQQRVRMKQPAETTRLRAKQAFQNAIQADSGNLRAKCGLAALLLRESNSQAEAEQLFLSGALGERACARVCACTPCCWLTRAQRSRRTRAMWTHCDCMQTFW